RRVLFRSRQENFATLNGKERSRQSEPSGGIGSILMDGRDRFGQCLLLNRKPAGDGKAEHVTRRGGEQRFHIRTILLDHPVAFCTRRRRTHSGGTTEIGRAHV